MTPLISWKIVLVLELALLLLGSFLIFLGDQKRREKKAWQHNMALGIVLVAGAARAIITTINNFF